MRNLPTYIITFFVALLFLAWSAPSIAQKTDVIVFKNGDRLTVDIQQLDRGRLRASTIGFGTIQIQLRVIASVETSKTYQVGLRSGERMLGTLKGVGDGEGIVVQTDEGAEIVQLSDVVLINRVKREESIWNRLDGSVQLGLNYTSGSEIGQSNFGLNLDFREAEYAVGTDVSATFTTGSATNDTQRFNWGTYYLGLLRNRWFWLVNSDLERNDELGIDLRALAGGGMGRFLIRDNRSQWAASLGLAGSRELRAADADETQLEAQFITDYSFYVFVPRRTDFNVTLAVYPGITNADRLRGSFDTKFRWEIIGGFTWDLTYFFTWDNDPPPGASKRDTGVTTSLGYTF
jgi:hypothetical protein